MTIILFQRELRPEIPNVYGTLDYRNFRDTLTKIDSLLSNSGLEQELLSQAMDRYVTDNQIDAAKFYNGKDAGFHYKKFRHALRCNIARHLTGESYRAFSIRVADSELFQWFTNINPCAGRKAISKSSLERYEKCFDGQLVAEIIHAWLADLALPEKALTVGLNEPIDYKNTFTDSTCVKANIHFPVDWVLLRDAARSLIAAIKTIRRQGLKHRMIEPQLLLKQMNKLCISMTHVRRTRDSKKQRKAILREMKKLSQCIARHGKRYRQLLNDKWENTEWTYLQAQQVMRRIDVILEQLPTAIKQAHERIIGERIISTQDKILSLYDKDAHVIVRGKAGNEVEFGQGLLLTEQKNGLIIDWQLFAEQPPADSKVILPAQKRMAKYYGYSESVCADRAFSDKKNDAFFKEHNIYNAICPKSPTQLQEKLLDPVFLTLQTRRSQTEARIGIFKNVFLGKPLRSRITEYKRMAINWCVLTHDLWVLARMAIAADKENAIRKKPAANAARKLKVA